MYKIQFSDIQDAISLLRKYEHDVYDGRAYDIVMDTFQSIQIAMLRQWEANELKVDEITFEFFTKHYNALTEKENDFQLSEFSNLRDNEDLM